MEEYWERRFSRCSKHMLQFDKLSSCRSVGIISWVACTNLSQLQDFLSMMCMMCMRECGRCAWKSSSSQTMSGSLD